MSKREWSTPRLINFSNKVIRSGDVCLGYEAAMGTAVAFYTPGTGLVTAAGGCSTFSVTDTCEGNNIRVVNGNTCAPSTQVCS